jgi:hypothetical protein
MSKPVASSIVTDYRRDLLMRLLACAGSASSDTVGATKPALTVNLIA